MPASVLWRKKGEQFFDDDGAVLFSGYLEYRNHDTNDLITVYKDAALAVEHEAQIDLSVSGRLTDPIYLPEGTFKESLFDSGGNELFNKSGYPGAISIVAPSSTFTPLRKSYSANTTLPESDNGYLVDIIASGDQLSVTLPTLDSLDNGWHVWLRLTGTPGSALIQTQGEDTINGDPSLQLVAIDAWMLIVKGASDFAAYFGAPAAGAVVQAVSASYATYSSHTDTIPKDDTVPAQADEGDQILSLAITPKKSTNEIRGHVSVPVFGATSGNETVVAVFRGTACVAVGIAKTEAIYTVIPITFNDAPGSVSPQTYSVRVGTNGTGTSYVNGSSSGRLFGGASKATINLYEVEA